MQRVAQVLLPFIIFLRARWRPSSSGRQISAMKETERNIIAGGSAEKQDFSLKKSCFDVSSSQMSCFPSVLFPLHEGEQMERYNASEKSSNG